MTEVRKISATVPFSIELLLDAGAITEDQAREMGWEPPPPVPWRRRARWALQSWWWDHRPHLHLGPCEDDR